MNFKVVYHSKTGNTKKIAGSISKAAGTIAETIPEKIFIKPVDMLFIGDGIYAGKADIKTENFIKTLNGDIVKNAAVFGTYGGQNKAIIRMKELLKKQGINVMEETFGCKGKCWMFFNRKHPDAQELKAAHEFTKRILKKIK